jgi:spermidine/putrescine transport system substrate-binding protein
MSRLQMILAGSAVALAVTGLPAMAGDPDLTVFDWSSFDNPDLVKPYVAAHGDAPTYSIFADDDEAFQKISSGFKVDVAHPCAQMIPKYRDAGLIEPWDVSKIPHFNEIDKRFLDSKIFMDDTGVWYIPTDYAYTATAYNKDTVPAEDVATLQVFADPKYAGRISLPDNSDDVWALALLATGVTDWTNINDDQFKAAADWLRAVHPSVVAYWADPSELAQLMQSGQVQIAWSWNDTVALLQSEGFPIGFERQAKEGASSWFCGYVNVKDAPGSEDKAYDYINAFLDYGTEPVLLSTIGYATTVTTSMAMIPEADLKAAFVDPVSGTLLAQTPLDPALRDRMVNEFEEIKAGF